MIRRSIILSIGALAFLLGSDRTAAQDKVRVAELSPRAEASIDKGLRYLGQTQNPNGSWGQANQVAITSLALMAYMVKGHFPDREPHGDTMAKGVDYLLKQARANKGYLGSNMYEHGLGTLALSEAWGESTRSDEVRDALKSAVSVIVRNQTAKGGWGYYPDRDIGYQDVSITVMQIVALASAKEAGILVPDDTMKRAIVYVKSCQGDNGAFGYQTAGDHRIGVPFARTSAGVTSLIMAGERKSDEVKRGLEYLHGLGDRPFHTSYMWFYYGHYYAVQAMYQASEKDYQAWYPRVRDTLVNAQDADGSWKGGIPAGVNTKIATDRDSYCTPMAILILGVPYRYLPIYQR